MDRLLQQLGEKIMPNIEEDRYVRMNEIEREGIVGK